LCQSRVRPTGRLLHLENTGIIGNTQPPVTHPKKQQARTLVKGNVGFRRAVGSFLPGFLFCQQKHQALPPLEHSNRFGNQGPPRASALAVPPLDAPQRRQVQCRVPISFARR
jgi:hypothetical protein